MKLARIQKATPLNGRRLRLQLDDGRVIERDVTPFLTGPIFEDIRGDDRAFRSVKAEGGTVVWANGADLCPDVLIWGGVPPDEAAAPAERPAAKDSARQQNLFDRLDRACSWIAAAQALPESQMQEVFMAFFIAFNAMYGKRQYEGNKTETVRDLAAFIDKVRNMHDADLDGGRATLTVALFRARSTIKAMMTNVFLRDAYWRREVPHDVLTKRFESQYSWADRRLKDGDWVPLIRLVLQRVVVLRNQIFHGCVTHGATSAGWESVEQGTAVLTLLVPAFADLMQYHGHLVAWDPLPYPRLGSTLHPKQSRLA